MPFLILAIRPCAPVQVLTSRATQRMATYTAQSFENAYKGQCKTKVVESGKAYCSQCGTTSFMDPKECKAPSDHTPDWSCGLLCSGVAAGVLA